MKIRPEQPDGGAADDTVDDVQAKDAQDQPDVGPDAVAKPDLGHMDTANAAEVDSGAKGCKQDSDCVGQVDTSATPCKAPRCQAGKSIDAVKSGPRGLTVVPEIGMLVLEGGVKMDAWFDEVSFTCR